MPLYSYNCRVCQIEFDQVRRMDERLTAICPSCGTSGRQIMTTPCIVCLAGEGVWDWGLGQMITGPGQRNRLLREKGLHDLDVPLDYKIKGTIYSFDGQPARSSTVPRKVPNLRKVRHVRT